MSFWVTGSVAAFDVISGFQQGEAIRENAQLKQQIGEFNAQFAEADAYNAEKEGETEEARYSTEISKTLGEQRVAFASKGVDVNFGTAAELQAETKIQGMLNVMDIQKAANAKARGFQTEAMNDRLQGAMSIAQGELNASAAQTSGILKGASVGLSGYSKSK